MLLVTSQTPAVQLYIEYELFWLSTYYMNWQHLLQDVTTQNHTPAIINNRQIMYVIKTWFYPAYYLSVLSLSPLHSMTKNYPYSVQILSIMYNTGGSNLFHYFAYLNYFQYIWFLHFQESLFFVVQNTIQDMAITFSIWNSST